MWGHTDTQTNGWVLCADGRQHVHQLHMYCYHLFCNFNIFYNARNYIYIYSTTKMPLVIIFALSLPFLQEVS